MLSFLTCLALRVYPITYRVHELAWTIDAGIRAGLLSDKHVEKLMGFFDDVIEAEAAAMPRPSKRPRWEDRSLDTRKKTRNNRKQGVDGMELLTGLVHKLHYKCTDDVDYLASREQSTHQT